MYSMISGIYFRELAKLLEPSKCHSNQKRKKLNFVTVSLDAHKRVSRCACIPVENQFSVKKPMPLQIRQGFLRRFTGNEFLSLCELFDINQICWRGRRPRDDCDCRMPKTSIHHHETLIILLLGISVIESHRSVSFIIHVH